jgi:hypothetical protein
VPEASGIIAAAADERGEPFEFDFQALSGTARG